MGVSGGTADNRKTDAPAELPGDIGEYAIAAG